MGKLLNTDELTWLRAENKRLAEELAKYQNQSENDHLKKQVEQLNKQVDSLSDQVAQHQEEQKQKTSPLMTSKDWVR